jgi:hypothetical protein
MKNIGQLLKREKLVVNKNKYDSSVFTNKKVKKSFCKAVPIQTLTNSKRCASYDGLGGMMQC